VSVNAPLTGQTALVTGAAKRLGRALAKSLAEAGAGVVLHYRSSESDVESLAREIRETGGACWPVSADLAGPDGARTLFENAAETAGPIGILINNASIFPSDHISEVSWDSFTINTRINAYAPFELGRFVAQQGEEAVILNLLDTRIRDYDAAHASYHFSKRMLHTFTCFCAEAFAPKVRVNGIAPGLVLPPEGKDESYLADLAHTNPLGRYGSETDIVEAALYLIRARFVTGQVVYVDGGRHLRGGLYGS
jgi:pteridine reductase